MEEQEQERQDDPLEVPGEGLSEGDQLTFQQGFTMGVATEKDVVMNSTASVGVAAGRDVNFSNGFGMSVHAGRDVSVTNSFAGGVRSNGSAEINNTLALLATAKDAQVNESFIGILFSREAALDEDSRVLLGARQAAAFGAAFGAAFALFGWLLRRNSRGRRGRH